MGALVLALNPSIDAEWRVERVQWEEKNNVLSGRRWAGGKGVNVARWLQHLGAKPRLLIPLGGATGKELSGYLRKEHLATTVISLKQASRVNVIVTTDEGRQLRFNPLGPELSKAEWKSILSKWERMLFSATCLVLSGSLPRGVDNGAYGELIRRAPKSKAKTILDCDGAALAAAVKAKPFLVKPNEHELAKWLGRSIRSRAGLIKAANLLSSETGGWVLVSLGAQGGLLVNQKLKVQLSARSPRVKPVNTVGAGDALVAGVVQQIELGAVPERWLQMGVAVGTAATQCAAGELPSLDVVEQIAKKIEVR